MKKNLSIVALGLVLAIFLVLIAGQKSAEARFYQGGSDAMQYEIVRTCTDGIEFGILADVNPDIPTAVPGLQGKLVWNDAEILPSTPLSVEFSGSTLSGHTLIPWTIRRLTPGLRIKLILYNPHAFGPVIDEIYTTVADCQLTGTAPTTETDVYPSDSGPEIIPAMGSLTSPAFTGTSTDIVVVDVNVALYISTPATLDPSQLSASLKSPEETVVTLFDGPGVNFSVGDDFGSYCDYQIEDFFSGDILIGDPKPNFVLDDDSAFSFYRRSRVVPVVGPFTNTAIAPKGTLGVLVGEVVSGEWELTLDNGSNTDAELMCWALEITYQSTDTPPPACVTYTSDDVPQALPGTFGSLSSSLTVPDGGVINDVNVNVNMSHTWVGDLIFTLEHVSSGTAVTLIDRPGVPVRPFGCRADNIDAILDDEATSPVENACARRGTAISGTFIPNELLSSFDGADKSGDWVLTVNDVATPDTGTLNDWRVEICTVEAPLE